MPNDFHYNFEELVDVDNLKAFFSSLCPAIGIDASIISLDGLVLAGPGRQMICMKFHRGPPAAERMCIEFDAGVNRELLQKRRDTIRRCPHGLMVAAVPIIINNKHMANLFSGGFIQKPLDTDLLAEFKARAIRFGFDEKAYLAALFAVPVISEKRLPHIMQFMKRIAEWINGSGFHQIQFQQCKHALAGANAMLKEMTRPKAADTRWVNQTIESNPIPTYIINDCCQVTHWNHACEMLTGVQASDIIGTDKHREAFHPQRRRYLADLIVENADMNEITMLYGKKCRNSLMVEGGYEREDYFPQLGRHGKWLFCTAAPLKNADGRVIGAIETMQDMTTRWLAEQELKASEARYRQLFESAHDAILIIKNGVVVDCNQEAVNLTGIPRKILIGQSPLDFSPGIQPDGVTSKELLAEKTAIAFQDQPQQFDWRIRKNNGDHIDVEVSLTRFKIGDTPHGLAIVRDATIRKKMVQALREREQELNEKTRYLEKVNQALKASLDHREIEKRSIEEHLLVNLKRLIHPYLEDLRQCRLDADATAYVNIISTHLDDLASQVSRTLSAKYMDFTPTEIRIADFIRDGKSTKEIAVLLNLSPSSVQWHRKNIREKLGLTHKKINLCTFLTSLKK